MLLARTEAAMVQLCCLLLVLLSISVRCRSTAPPIVQLSQGRLEGTVQQTEDPPPYKRRTYASFKGIPYAQPPVGNMRWEDPVDHPGWNGTRKADSFGSACTQISSATGQVTGSEDCLYLNVYTPKLPGVMVKDKPGPGTGTPTLLPVIFYIHPGGFIRGSGDIYSGSRFLREDVVFVSFNYRLGLLGFLCTETPEIAGNHGMLDQVFALKWVAKNIDRFGGDPTSITVMGASAGAASAHYFILSPLTKGLFHRVILLSGSAVADWAYQPRPLQYAEEVAGVLNCPIDPRSALNQCLHGKTDTELIEAQTKLIVYIMMNLKTAPVVDAKFRSKPFLPKAPRDLYECSKCYDDVPLLTSTTKNEGLLFVIFSYLSLPDAFNSTLVENELVKIGIHRHIFWDLTPPVEKFMHSLIKGMYLSKVNYRNPMELFPKLSKYFTDESFLWPQDTTVRLHANHSKSPVYVSLFSHRKCFSSPSYVTGMANALRKKGVETSMFDTGVTHVDDLLYIFNFGPSFGTLKPDDWQISKILTKLCAHFATHGVPPRDRNWQRSTFETVKHHVIGGNNKKIISNYEFENAGFYENVIPKVKALAQGLPKQHLAKASQVNH